MNYSVKKVIMRESFNAMSQISEVKRGYFVNPAFE